MSEPRLQVGSGPIGQYDLGHAGVESGKAYPQVVVTPHLLYRERNTALGSRTAITMAKPIILSFSDLASAGALHFLWVVLEYLCFWGPFPTLAPILSLLASPFANGG